MRLHQLIETTVNYNHIKNMWVLRKDAVNGKFPAPNKEVPQITLSDATPVIDYDALYDDKRVYAFVQGDPVSGVPEGYEPRAITFVKGRDEPFVHIDDKSSFTGADFVEFNQEGAFAYYKHDA